MIWESVAWVAVAVAAIPLVDLIEVPLESRWPKVWPAVRGLAPWLIGLGPSYLALVSGAVLARSFGLYGRGGAIGWALSVLLCASVLAATWALRERLAGLTSGRDLIPALLDEPRWALYRAAGVLWLGAWGLLIGFFVGTIEWALRTRPRLAASRGDRTTWLSLIQLALSSLLFALTGNFWLTWTSQAAGWYILRPDDRSLGEGP